MSEALRRVEAVLFSSGKFMPLKDLRRSTRLKEEDVRKAVEELKELYKDTSLIIVEENGSYKMTVREKYLPYIRRIVTDLEMTKSHMETLAVIAWKNPARQADIIKIRTNKAYDHIKALEDQGFITTEKEGRTKKLKLTSKFYEYFEIDDKGIKEVFNDVHS